MASQIETAKSAAVQRYLSIEQPGIANALAVSTKPQHNVTGVGIGPKIVNGKITDVNCVRFYVERKVPKEALVAENLLPSVIEGVPTDIIETGRFIAGSPATLAAVAAPPIAAEPVRGKIRPTQPGCSVGFKFTGSQEGFVMAGTFGVVVETGENLFILSNNHVLADENNLPLGSPIFQPGLLDGGNPATDQVAALEKFIPIDPAVVNLVDCAIARFLDKKLASPVFLGPIGKLKAAAAFTPSVGNAVEKMGRTSGFTTGKVIDVNATVKVNYTMGTVSFDDQMLIVGDSGSFSAAGDSGSLIVDIQAKQGTGLLFAGSSTHTIANKLSNVLQKLGIQLVI